jgi:hypothetical protein
MIEITPIDAKDLVTFRRRKLAGSVIGTRIHNQNLTRRQPLESHPLTQVFPRLRSVAGWDYHRDLRTVDALISPTVRFRNRRHGRTPLSLTPRSSRMHVAQPVLETLLCHREGYNADQNDPILARSQLVFHPAWCL